MGAKSLLNSLLGESNTEKLLDKIGSFRKDIMLGRTFPRYYNERKGRPINPRKVIFLEYRSEVISDSFLLLYDYLRDNTDYELVFHNLNHMVAHHDEYVKRCLAFLEDLSDAPYLFLNDANEVVSCLDLREETKVIQVWHACGAFKKWGMSTASKEFGADLAKLKRHPSYRNLDYVTVSSTEVVWAYAEAMDLENEKEKILPIGVSRTDVFFDPVRREEAEKRLKEVFPEAASKKVILYAPTYRGKVQEAYTPGNIDFDRMYEEFGEDCVFVIKSHPYVKRPVAIPEELKDFARDVSSRMKIEDLLMTADVCITDYSSLIFEYSLMEKPMLFYVFDHEDYEMWRGFYYPFEEMTPGPLCYDHRELIKQLHAVLEGFDKDEISAFRERFMCSCDGRSTDRILKLMFGDDIMMRRRED